MSEKIDRIRSKIDRTKKHILDLQFAIDAFLSTDPYKSGTNRDPDSGKLIYYITSVEDTHPDVTQIAGDAFGGMVSILDHLAYGLFLKANPGGDGRHVYFPIARNATNMAEHVAKTEGKIKGIPANIVTAFNALEPYKGGKGHELWVLNELNNLSKHRELIAVGGKFQDIDIASHFSELVRRRFGRAAITRDPDEGIPIFVKPAYALCPLKDGDVLFTDAPNAEPNPKLHFRFNVSLNEPQIVHAQPLIETVDRLFQLVSQIVSDFSSEV